jgi:hypothetical protein
MERSSPLELSRPSTTFGNISCGDKPSAITFATSAESPHFFVAAATFAIGTDNLKIFEIFRGVWHF